MLRPVTIPPRRSVLVLFVALALACSSDEMASAPEPSWPPGTVLAVDDLPITAEEVDSASVWIERIERMASPDHLRRLALTNVVLPCKLARLMAPQEREQALARARQTLAELRQGTAPGPTGSQGALGEHAAGTFQELGIPVWGTALDLPAGAWSEPVEDFGRFVLVRRLSTQAGAVPLAIQLEVDLFAFPYLDPALPEHSLDNAYERFRLTIVDPAWRVIVPELLQYKMGVHGP